MNYLAIVVAAVAAFVVSSVWYTVLGPQLVEVSAPGPGAAAEMKNPPAWKIAVEVVSAETGAKNKRAVASYWAELVRAATPHLRSGDPNLIYPGEEIDLPPLGDRSGDRR